MAVIGILGAGTWGTALAKLLVQNGHDVTLWSAIPAELTALQTTHRHPKLEGVVLPQALRFSDSLESEKRGDAECRGGSVSFRLGECACATAVIKTEKKA